MADPINRSTPLAERVQALEVFAVIAAKMVSVGDLQWSAVDDDYRLLAINSALRRQLENIRATALLARQDLGHLAVSFVRASLEDVMYLTFFASLDIEHSQKLFRLMGSWDALRSLLAQRKYVGDETMGRLWYSADFLDQAQRSRDRVRTDLAVIQKEYRWSGGILPSGDWIADRVGHRDLYDYLHAATSRALHFSAGEVLRRGWGEPGGKVVTDKAEFRDHLSAFAIDQLWRLYIETWQSAMPLLEAAGIGSDDDLEFSEIEPALERMTTMGNVPLVHAHEWNLTPRGPLNLFVDDRLLGRQRGGA